MIIFNVLIAMVLTVLFYSPEVAAHPCPPNCEDHTPENMAIYMNQQREIRWARLSGDLSDREVVQDYRVWLVNNISDLTQSLQETIRKRREFYENYKLIKSRIGQERERAISNLILTDRELQVVRAKLLLGGIADGFKVARGKAEEALA
jgi:hypothetical protein